MLFAATIYSLNAAVPGKPVGLFQKFYEADGTTTFLSYFVFWWNNVPGATRYKIVNKAYTPASNQYVGDVTVLETTDSFKKITFHDYELILHNYEKTVDSQYLKECPSGVCLFGLRYESYLVAVNDEGESPMASFSVLPAQLTDVKRFAVDAAITIYPNPASNYINVSMPEDKQSMAYTIYEATGRVVMAGTTGGAINTEKLAGGVYLLTLSHEGISHTERLIISK